MKITQMKITTPHVMIFKEKHDDRMFLINDSVDIIKALRIIAEERLNDGYWYDDTKVNQLTDKETLENIFKLKINSIAYNIGLYKFMDSRRDFQYEGWQLTRLTIT
jgi:hypothetical protein